jgi:hypothetical protein
MALQKQIVPIPLIKGIDKFTPDALLDPDQLSDGLNCEMLKSGEITKRNGFAIEFNVATSLFPMSLMPANSAAGCIYSSGEYTVPDKGAASITSAQRGQETYPYSVSLAKVFDLIGTSGNVINCDVSRVSDDIYVAVVTRSSAGVLSCTVYNFDIYFNPLGSESVSFSGAHNGSVKMVGNRLLTWLDAATDNYTYYTYAGNGTFLASSVVNSSIGTWDACETDTGQFALVYDNGANIVLSTYNGTTLLNTINISRTNVTRVTVFRDSGTGTGSNICVGLLRSAANKIEVQRFNSSLSLQQTLSVAGGADTYYNITGLRTPSILKSGSPDIFVAVEFGSSTASATSARGVRVYNVNTLLTQIGPDIPRAGIASKMFLQAAFTSIPLYPQIFLAHRSEDTFNLQNSYFLMTLANYDSTNQIECRPVYGQGPNYKSRVISSNYGPNTSVIGVTSSLALFPAVVRGDADTAANDSNSTYTAKGVRIDYEARTSCSKPIRFGSSNIFANGVIKKMSADGISEFNFLLYPDAPQGFTSTGAGSVAAGTYQYCFVYEYIDSDGNLHESAPSQVTTVTHTGTNNYTVSFLAPGWITFSSYRLALYRTTAGGTVFYRNTSSDYNPSTFTFGTITDSLADADLDGNRILYTTGGVVENISPPNANWIASIGNRLWTFEHGRRDSLWFTKSIVDGFVPQFSDLLKLAINQDFGEIIAVAGVDDKVIIFKRYAVFVSYGSGPTDSLVGEFNPPELITQGVGCSNPRSIVQTPAGIFFQSDEGIYIVDKGLGVQFIGKPLYKTEGTIRAACYDPAFNRVLFLTGTTVWLFNLTTMNWLQWTVPDSIDLLCEGGSIYLLTSPSSSVTSISKLTAATWQDRGSNYEQRIRLGQFQFAGIQGYQRIYKALVSGRSLGDASGSITVKNYFDGSSTATDTQTITQTATVSGNKMLLEIRPSKQKCETMQVELSHTANNSGITVNAVTAEVGALTGAGRRASTGRAV